MKVILFYFYYILYSVSIGLAFLKQSVVCMHLKTAFTNNTQSVIHRYVPIPTLVLLVEIFFFSILILAIVESSGTYWNLNSYLDTIVKNMVCQITYG